jgi:hypothetical protein
MYAAYDDDPHRIDAEPLFEMATRQDRSTVPV